MAVRPAAGLQLTCPASLSAGTLGVRLPVVGAGFVRALSLFYAS